MEVKAESEETKEIETDENFYRLLKIGVYKELHKKGLLTDEQLNELLGQCP